METSYSVFYLHFSFCLPFSVVGCSEDNEPSGEVEIDQLPGITQFFLSNYFPGQPLGEIKRMMTRQENGQLLYRAAFPDEVEVEFNENGGWKSLMVSGQGLSESPRSLFGGVIAYVKRHLSSDPFVSVENTCYGECVLLNSGRKIAFYYDQTCAGCEVNIRGGSSLPQSVRGFTEEYLPDGTFEAVIEHMSSREFPAGYAFWLKNGFKCMLGGRGEQTEVNGGAELLPTSILGILPAKATEDLRRNHPNVQVTFVHLKGTRYTIQTSKTMYMTIDPRSGLIEILLIRTQVFAEEYFGKQSFISISHLLHSDVLDFTVRLSGGFSVPVNEGASAWISIDGNRFVFPEKLVALLPKRVTDYISGCSNSEITQAGHSVAVSYPVELANGDRLVFDSQEDSLGKRKIELNASEKVYRYMCCHYPNDLDVCLGSYSTEGWVYKLSGGSQVRSDRNDNFAEIISLK